MMNYVRVEMDMRQPRVLIYNAWGGQGRLGVSVSFSKMPIAPTLCFKT